MPFNIPQRTSACKTGSRCRGGKLCRSASVFAEIGFPCSCIATSMTAATARTALRGNRGIERKKRYLTGIGSSLQVINSAILVVGGQGSSVFELGSSLSSRNRRPHDRSCPGGSIQQSWPVLSEQ